MQKIALKEGGYLFSKETKNNKTNASKQTKSEAKENKAAFN